MCSTHLMMMVTESGCWPLLPLNFDRRAQKARPKQKRTERKAPPLRLRRCRRWYYGTAQVEKPQQKDVSGRLWSSSGDYIHSNHLHARAPRYATVYVPGGSCACRSSSAGPKYCEHASRPCAMYSICPSGRLIPPVPSAASMMSAARCWRDGAARYQKPPAAVGTATFSTRSLSSHRGMVLAGFHISPPSNPRARARPLPAPREGPLRQCCANPSSGSLLVQIIHTDVITHQSTTQYIHIQLTKTALPACCPDRDCCVLMWPDGPNDGPNGPQGTQWLFIAGPPAAPLPLRIDIGPDMPPNGSPETRVCRQ